MHTRARREPGKTFEAYFDALRIALGPLMFQAARALRDHGILEALEHESLGAAEIAARLGLTPGGVRVLLDAGACMRLVEPSPRGWTLARAGHLMLHDEMTRVHFDFVQDVCYEGAAHLPEAVKTGAPAGLRVFGSWETIYHALDTLPPRVQASWNRYDHYFSAAAFPSALPVVFARRPRRLLDVGGNLGDWAIRCARHDPDVQVTILDLPGQTAPALRAAAEAGLAARVDAQAIDLRDHGRPFPSGYDAVWMSQFLDCFSEEDAAGLLRRGAAALAPGGRLYVLEPCWDRQPNEIGAYCLRAASLYFVCMASGRSGFFHSEDLRRLAESAGLEIEEERDGLGLGHTLFVCRRERSA